MRKSLGILTCLLLIATTALTVLPVEVSADTLVLKIITPHTESIRTEYKRAFDAYYFAKTGNHVDIQYLEYGTSEVIPVVDAAFAATNEETARIDIWWGGGVDPFIAQKAKGHLLAYQISPTTLALIPNNISGVPMYDKDYKWYGQALSGFGIIYNKVVIAAEGLPTPKVWQDLTDMRLKGWVGSADPSFSGSTHMVYEIIVQAYGWTEGMKTATMLGANVKTWPQSSSAVPKSVTAGEVAVGLAIDFYAWAEVDKVGSAKIDYVVPEGLSVINPDSIAILKGAPNLELAKEFVEFVMSKDGQKLLMLKKGAPGGPVNLLIGRMCVMPSLYAELGNQSVVPVNPFTVKSSLKYNETLGSLRYVLLNDIIKAMIIDQQRELSAAWGEIIGVTQTLAKANVTSPKLTQAINMLGSVPLTEAQTLALAANWTDPALRNTYIAQWRTFAVQKYANATKLAKEAAADVSQKITELQNYYQGIITRLEGEKSNNLYMGLGGGLAIGLVIGVAIAYLMTRRKEIAAVKT